MNPLIIATRPKTLIASMSPICIGTAMAYAEGKILFWVLFFTLLTGIGIQISTNFANDLYDFLKGADTKERKGPPRVTASGFLQVAQVKIATFSIMMMTAAFGSVLVYRGGWIIGILVALALLLALAYTTGPYPLSYLGIAEIFVLIFFGPVAAGFTYYLQTLTFSSKPFIAGIAPGLISCGLLVVNNLRDVQEDRKSNKNTLVARFGIPFGKGEYALCLGLAPLIPLYLYTGHSLVLTGLICLLPSAALITSVFKCDDPYLYNPILGKTGRLLTLYTLIFSVGYLL